MPALFLNFGYTRNIDKRNRGAHQVTNIVSAVIEGIGSIVLHVLLVGVTNAVLIDGKQAIAFRKTRAVIDLADTGFSSPLLQTETCCTSMGNDITSDGFLGIWVEHGTWSSVDLGNDLIGDHNRNAEFVCEALQCTHELGQMCLP